MGLFDKLRAGGGLMDVIRCDEKEYLVWKWHPQGTNAGDTKKENAIRWGSSLRVQAGEVAVFVYTKDGNSYMDFIEGPHDESIKTDNFPVLTNIIGLAYDGRSPFQAEVYFINLAYLIQIKFGVPYFDVFDPRFLDYGVPVAVRGSISFKITDYQNFVKLHRLRDFSLDDFKVQIRDAVSRYSKGIVSNAPSENNIPVVQLERSIDIINDLLEERIKNRLYNEFGVTVSSVDVGAIDIDKTSEGYVQLMAVTKDLTTKTMQAQTEINIKEMKDSQQLGILERAGKAFVDIKEGAYERHKQTQMQNFPAYQMEAQENVGVAGAKGMGQMGSGGGGGTGFNPGAVMAGMAVGSAVGQNIAGNMNNMMGGMNQAQATPPPIPGTVFNVALNGQPTGPFDLATLSKMMVAGEFARETLVWTNGMSDWAKAGDVEALKGVFSEMPPIPSGGVENEGMPPIPKTE